MISKHKDLAIVFVRAISMLIIVIYHYSCSLVQDHITNKHLPLYGYASGRWGQSAVYTFLIISGYVLFMNYASHFSFKKYYYRRFRSIYPSFWLVWLAVFIIRSIQHQTIFWGGNPIYILFSIIGIDGYFLPSGIGYYSVGEWFLGVIILIYILFPVFLTLWKNHQSVVYMIISAIFILQIICDLGRTDFFVCTASFLAGIWFYEHRNFLLSKWTSFISFSIILVLCNIDFRSYFGDNCPIVFMGFILFIFLYSFGYFVMKFNFPFISFLAKYSYQAMLVHHVLTFWIIRFCGMFRISVYIGLIFELLATYIGAFIVKKSEKYIFSFLPDQLK